MARQGPYGPSAAKRNSNKNKNGNGANKIIRSANRGSGLPALTSKQAAAMTTKEKIAYQNLRNQERKIMTGVQNRQKREMKQIAASVPRLNKGVSAWKQETMKLAQTIKDLEAQKREVDRFTRMQKDVAKRASAARNLKINKKIDSQRVQFRKADAIAEQLNKIKKLEKQLGR